MIKTAWMIIRDEDEPEHALVYFGNRAKKFAEEQLEQLEDGDLFNLIEVRIQHTSNKK